MGLSGLDLGYILDLDSHDFIETYKPTGWFLHAASQ